jgi:hypothetical protein
MQSRVLLDSKMTRKSDRAITDCSPEPPANHIIWRMSQPEREGLSGGEAGPGSAAAGGLVGAAGGCQAGRILLDQENPHQGIRSGELPKKQCLNPFHALYLNNRLNMSNFTKHTLFDLKNI